MIKKLFCIISTAALLQGLFVSAAENEWTFDQESNGSSLSNAINYGSSITPAQFNSGFESTLFKTNRTLLYTGAATTGVWTNGALLDAALLSNSKISGVHYLRYDVKYALTNRLSNRTAKMFGVYFTDDTGDRAAGMVMGYDITNTLKASTPVNRTLTEVTNNLPRQGTLVVISEVNLDVMPATLRVWYSTGSNNFDVNTPNVSTNVNLTSINNLKFHATGDFPAENEKDYVAMDNIRQSSSWSEIVESSPDLTTPSLQVRMIGTPPAFEVGETKTLTFVIKNTGRNATDVTSVLSYIGLPSSFTVIPNNASVYLNPLGTVTNSYQVTAHMEASYLFTVRAKSTQAEASLSFKIPVGPEVIYLNHAIEEIENGRLGNLYETNEVLRVTVVSTNTGSQNVSYLTNSLSSDSYFIVTPVGDVVYPVVNIGNTVTSVYEVVIRSTATDGDHIFTVVNRGAGRSWSDTFKITVFNHAVPIVTNTINMAVVEGSITNIPLLLTNAGNVDVSFVISDNGTMPVPSYHSEMVKKSLIPFSPVYDENDNTVITRWLNMTNSSALSSDTMNIGFDFRLGNQTYTIFSVYTDGRVFLQNIDGEKAYLVAYSNITQISTNLIRYKKEAGSLIVSWGDRFQIAITEKGDVLFLYGTGVFDPANIWIECDESAYFAPRDVLDVFPGVGNGVQFIRLKSWIDVVPSSGIVTNLSDFSSTITANALGQLPGDYPFTLTVEWGNGDFSKVLVNLSVLKPMAGIFMTTNSILSVSNGLSIVSNVAYASFYHPVDSRHIENITLVNTGDVELVYTIIDQGARVASFEPVITTKLAWEDVTLLDVVNKSYGSYRGGQIALKTERKNGALMGLIDEGYSESLPFGFEFPFAGKFYTNFSIGVNGCISLGQSRPMDKHQEMDYYQLVTVNAVNGLGGYLEWRLKSSLEFYNYLHTIDRSAVPVGTGYAYIYDNSTVTNPVPPQVVAPFFHDLILRDDSDISYISEPGRILITWKNMRVRNNQIDKFTFRAILSLDGGVRFQYDDMSGTELPYDFICGVRDSSPGSILTNQLFTYAFVPLTDIFNVELITNYNTMVTTNYDVIRTVTNGISSIVAGAYVEGTSDVVIKPNRQFVYLDQDKRSGILPANGGSATFSIVADTFGTELDAYTNSFLITSPYTTNTLFVTMNVNHSPDPEAEGPLAAFSESDELLFGSSGELTVVLNEDRSRTISWPVPTRLSALPRTFAVEYTTNLMSGWQVLKVLESGVYRYTDTEHSDEPVIYYRVTVQ